MLKGRSEVGEAADRTGGGTPQYQIVKKKLKDMETAKLKSKQDVTLLDKLTKAFVPMKIAHMIKNQC